MATKKKKMTMNEFKFWLTGVEELQPDGWHPSEEQWKLIRNKIDSIVEPKVQQPAPVVQQPQFQPQLQPQFQPPVQQPDSALPVARAPRQPTTFDPLGKTADIDTAAGDYTSTFV